jgi:hypothetical protein
MSEKLTDRLRRYSEGCVAYKLDADFADAVQKAAEITERLADGDLYCMKDGVLYKAEFKKPKCKTIRMPPIQISEPPKEKQFGKTEQLPEPLKEET